MHRRTAVNQKRCWPSHPFVVRTPQALYPTGGGILAEIDSICLVGGGPSGSGINAGHRWMLLCTLHAGASKTMKKGVLQDFILPCPFTPRDNEFWSSFHEEAYWGIYL